MHHSRGLASFFRCTVALGVTFVLTDCEFGVVGPPLSVEALPLTLSASVCNAIVPAGGCCMEAFFDSSPICRESDIRDHIAASVEAARQAGLTYDGDCAYEFGSVPCTDPTSGSLISCQDDCQIFFGDVAKGELCVSHGHRMSDCQQGLVCAPDRTCHEPCRYSFTAPENGFCGPARGMWFVTCDAGLACTDDGTCEPAPAIGAPCGAGNTCAVGGWCDEASATCVEQLSGGSSCASHDQCASAICKEGACFEPESPWCGRWAW